MRNNRFNQLRPGNCFIHRNDIYIKTRDYGNCDAVNLRTGELRIFLPFSRVTRINMDLGVINPDGTTLASLPLESFA